MGRLSNLGKALGKYVGIPVGAAAVGIGVWFGVHNLMKPEVLKEYKIDNNQVDTVYLDERVCYEIRQGHKKVLLGMGGLWERVQGAGFHCRYPQEVGYDVNVDKVFRLERGFRTKKSGVQTEYEEGDFSKESLMVTGDEGELHVMYSVEYKKSDPSAFLFNVRNPHKTVADVAESALREVIAGKEYTQVLKTGKELIWREAAILAQEILDSYGVGITINSLLLQPVTLPTKEVEDAYHDLQDAKLDAKRYQEEALAVKATKVEEAKGQRDMMIQTARGRADLMKNEARGEVERFKRAYAQYGKGNLDLHRFRLHQRTVRGLLKANVTVIDKDIGEGGGLMQHLIHGKEK